MKEKQGYTWIECKSGGFWSKNEVKGVAHSHKIPLFCPHCRKYCGDVDHKYLEEYGICYECHTLYVENRQNPLIDLSKYKK